MYSKTFSSMFRAENNWPLSLSVYIVLVPIAIMTTYAQTSLLSFSFWFVCLNVVFLFIHHCSYINLKLANQKTTMARRN